MKKMLLRGALLIAAVSMVLVNNAVAGLIFQDAELDGPPHYEVVNGIEWLFTVTNGEASIGYHYCEPGGEQPGGEIWSAFDAYLSAVTCTNATCLRVPKSLAGCSVRAIKPYAFGNFGYPAYYIQAITIPACVTNIGRFAMRMCKDLECVMFEGAPPNGVVDGLEEILSDKEVCIYFNEKYAEEWWDVLDKAKDKEWLWEYEWDVYEPLPSIDFVTARQRYPWNGKVDIEYTVWGDIDAKAREEGSIPSLKVYAVDQSTSTTNIATELLGDMSLSEGTHKIVWDMNAQGLDIKSTNVVFHVACELKPGLYCIIDLSAGSSATSYPVSYANEIPSGSWSDEYKTTKLVLQRIEPGTCVATVDKPYYIGVFEMTQKQYKLVDDSIQPFHSGDKLPVENVSYEMLRGINKGAQYPSSSEVDDNSFIGKMRTRTGRFVDLPTDAQWEYACRAGTTTTYSYGDAVDGDYMWYVGNSGNTTHNVGTRTPNPWGLYDMHGNVWEWCLEWNLSYVNARTVRGGCWCNPAEYCTSDCQYRHAPYLGTYVGFRLAMPVPDPTVKPFPVICNGCTQPMRIDLTTGTRRAAKTETITYSANWVEGVGADAVAEVAVDGVVISAEAGSGTVEWTPTHNGTYELTHKVLDGGLQVGETLTATFLVAGIVPKMPVISPESGKIFDTSLTVSMKCATTNTTIHFTTNGTIPTLESPVYAKKFRIYGSATVNAIAFLEDGTAGEMATAQYLYGGKCKDPVIRPKDGTVFLHSGQVVSISWEKTNGVLRVTTDGSEPTEESPEYEGAFAIDETTTIKAKVFGDTWFDSEVVTATLTREWETVATPVITAQSQFTGSKAKVRLSCDTEGAVIRYTTDGSEPDASSHVYSVPFYVTASSTVKAYAVCHDYLDSAADSFAIEKVWGIGDTLGKPDHAFATSGDAEFVRVDDDTATRGESMKSGVVDNNQKSVLSTTVVGPGTLTFKWKASCEADDEYEWDHGEFKVDGKIKGQINGVTDWTEVSQRIEGGGEHKVTWTYVKDDVEYVEQDCIWVSDYDWETDLTETQTTQVPVPYEWLHEKCRDTVDEYDIYEKVAKQTAENRRLTVEQCYVAGVDPESTTNDLKAVITPDGNGGMKVSWDPDLREERVYKIWGKQSLEQGHEWEYPTNSLHRFFRVTVDMP